MAETVKTETTALELAKIIDDHNGIDLSVIDISGECSWTDYFIITTVSSQGHLKGLIKFLKLYLMENGIDIIHNQKKVSESGWTLIDCGNIVIHLMNKDVREFYDLERLWFSGNVIYHSSKSS